MRRVPPVRRQPMQPAKPMPTKGARPGRPMPETSPFNPGFRPPMPIVDYNTDPEYGRRTWNGPTFKKGGKVRGDGICTKGHTKGRMR